MSSAAQGVTGAETRSQVGWRDRRDIALLVLRVVIGVVFVAHGAQKPFGLGGGGLDATATAMAGNGLEPGIFFAVLAGIAEFGGGLLLFVGLLTPLAGLAIVGVMVVATALHLGDGLFLSNGGFEYTLSLTAMALALVLAGPGRLSLDHRLGLDRLFSATADRVRGPRR